MDDKLAEFVTHDEAIKIAQRFIDRHFGNSGKEFPRISIPADAGRDDDLRIMAYIKEQAEAYGYLSRLFKLLAPQCEPFPSMRLLVTQIDNLICGLQKEYAVKDLDRLEELFDDCVYDEPSIQIEKCAKEGKAIISSLRSLHTTNPAGKEAK